MNKTLFFLLISFLTIAIGNAQTEQISTDKIKVLNFATFHLSRSSDANTSEVDINDPQVKRDIERVVAKLVKFRPTIICIEVPATESAGTDKIYQEYKIDQSNTTGWSEEINAIAFEVGRLTGVQHIYGIDDPIGFDYPKLMAMAENATDKVTNDFLIKNQESLDQYNALSILDKFININTDHWKSETFNFYNTLATMHTPGNYEGSEIIARFYDRNLRLYTNLVEVPATAQDRILVILGGTHTAYLDIFLRNNPRYELMDATDSTKY